MTPEEDYIPFLDDILTAPSQPWWFGHFAALQSPEMRTEYPIVRLAEAIHVVVIVHTQDGQPVDYVISPAIGQLLSGFVALLVGETGRLDPGTCSHWACVMARKVRYCLDHEQMLSECDDLCKEAAL